MTLEAPHDARLAAVAAYADSKAERCPRRLREGRSMATWLTLSPADRLAILREVVGRQRPAQRPEATTPPTRPRYAERPVFVHDEAALARARLIVTTTRADESATTRRPASTADASAPVAPARTAKQAPAAVVPCAGGCGRYLPAPSRHKPASRYCAGVSRRAARPRSSEQLARRAGKHKLKRLKPTAPACRS